MLLFETTALVGDAETLATVDLDKVCAIVNGGENLTGLQFDGGVTITITTPYLDVLKYIDENADEEEPERAPTPRKRK